MVAEVEQWDVIRPLRLGKRVQPAHAGTPVAVGKVAENARDDDRIVDLLLLDVGLADDDQRSALTRLEQGFHGGQRDRLMLGEVASLAVARGPDQGNDKDQRRGHTNLQEDFCLFTCCLLSR